MPAFMRTALLKHRLMRAYELRPAYQRNDYIGWIMRGKLKATQQRRVQQMLDELRAGGVYMNMKWNPKRAR